MPVHNPEVPNSGLYAISRVTALPGALRTPPTRLDDIPAFGRGAT
jgi:hypothetical protein